MGTFRYSGTLYGVWGSGPDMVYAVGTHADVSMAEPFLAVRRGGTWELLFGAAKGYPPNVGMFFNAVAGLSDGRVFVAGAGGFGGGVLMGQGTTWRSMTGSMYGYSAIWAGPDTTVLAAGRRLARYCGP